MSEREKSDPFINLVMLWPSLTYDVWKQSRRVFPRCKLQNTVLSVQKRFKKKITWKNFRLLHSILLLETQFDWRVWNFCSYRLHLKLYSCFLNWSIKYNKQRYLIMHDYNGPDVNIPFTMTIYVFIDIMHRNYDVYL